MTRHWPTIATCFVVAIGAGSAGVLVGASVPPRAVHLHSGRTVYGTQTIKPSNAGKLLGQWGAGTVCQLSLVTDGSEVFACVSPPSSGL